MWDVSGTGRVHPVNSLNDGVNVMPVGDSSWICIRNRESVPGEFLGKWCECEVSGKDEAELVMYPDQRKKTW